MRRVTKWKWMLPVLAAILGITMSALAMAASFTGKASASKNDGTSTVQSATGADALNLGTSGGCTGDCAACPIACGGVLAPAAEIVPAP